MIDFKNIIFKLELRTANNERVNKFALFTQYYSFQEQKWINLYRGELENGLFYVKSVAKSTVKTKAAFFEQLRNGQIPPIRIVPTEKITTSKKKEVVGSTFSFSLNQKDASFEFDFGALWFVPNEWIIETNDSFRDFVSVATLFPPVSKEKETALYPETKEEAVENPYESCKKELEHYANQLNAVTAQYETLYASNETLKKNYSALKDQKAFVDKELSEMGAQIKAQDNLILQLQTKIEELSKENTSENNPVPIKNLYTNIIQEIETANRFTESSSYKLSNISLKLKAIIQKDGDSISASLMDKSNSEKVNGNSISELVFDITPVRSTQNIPGKLPDLIGLTETAVRRILKSIDLRLNPVYQSNKTVVNGDSFKQSPASGSDFQANQLITVIFSKHE